MLPAIRRAGRFGRDERGVTAIEFAILALPFFTIVGAVLETALVFLGSQVIDSAVSDASRLVRTGQVQNATGYGPTNFRDAICAGLYGMFDCTKVRISVTVVGTNFDAVSIGYPLKTGNDCTSASCDWTLTENYAPGTGCEVILVQAYYKWPTVLNLPGFNFQSLPDGSRLLGASRVFMNEPFGGSDCT